MLTAMFPIQNIEVPIYSTTHPKKYEKIFLLAKNVFGKDRRIVSSLNEIENMRDVIKSQTKLEQFNKYIEVEELISSYPEAEMNTLCSIESKINIIKYKNIVLMYLIYKELLYKEEIIRVIY
jgi:hypothetical protein